MNTMNNYSIQNSIAGMPTQFHSYDVLLISGTSNNEAPRFAQGNHVGNQRFSVLLNLHRQKYIQAYKLGNAHECASIIQNILDTLTVKCVPNGRIFEQGRDNKWQKLDKNSPSTIAVIQNVFKYEPVEEGEMERSPKRFCGECRDSVSKNKSTPKPREFVDVPNPFDVVCKTNGLSFSVSQDSQYTGNNRLKVMLDLRMKSYNASSIEDRKTIIEGIVSSIIDDASGQFLQEDKSSGKYLILPRTFAISCVQNLLKNKTGVGREKNNAKYRQSEVQKLQQRKYKKSILGKLEKQKGGKGLELFRTSSGVAPPTRLNAFTRHNEFISKAA